MHPTRLTVVAAAIGAVAVIVHLGGGLAVAQEGATGSTDALLARVGARVLRYFETAQSIMATETVVVQRTTHSLEPVGPARRFVYDLRLDWEAAGGGGVPDAVVVRHLVTIDGRPANPGDDPSCGPQPITGDPLGLLAPTHRGEYVFTQGRPRRLSGRLAAIIEFRPVSQAVPEVRRAGDGECLQVVAPSQTRGRIWVDPESDDVLRFDQWLEGPPIPIPPALLEREGARRPPVPRALSFERSDFTARYAPVTFSGPDETLLLPSRAESLSMSRGTDGPGLRIQQTYSGYKRFVADSRLLP